MVIVSNTSDFHLMVAGDIKAKSDNVGVAFFTNGVMLVDHSRARGPVSNDSWSTLLPHQAKRGEIKILPGSDSLRLYDAYEVLTWKRRIFMKLFDTGHFGIIKRLETLPLFGESFSRVDEKKNPIRYEQSEIFLLPLK
jgi:hypothetical protein